MGIQTWQETLVQSTVDGPTITASGAVTCIPAPSRLILPNNYFYIGKTLRISMQGRISCVITTPGTARLDVRTGPSGTIVAFDTGALNLNIVAKTTIPWWAEIILPCRAVGTGTSSNFFGFGTFVSEAIIASPANSAGGNGFLNAPVGTPAVGTGFDNTAANAIDVFFTQTVSTGSFTVHNYRVDALN